MISAPLAGQIPYLTTKSWSLMKTSVLLENLYFWAQTGVQITKPNSTQQQEC